MSNRVVDWNYFGEHGPDKWHCLCEEFEQAADYKWQSPIALSEAENCEKMAAEGLTFDYVQENFIEQSFNHTFHFLPPNDRSKLFFNQKSYHLTDIHFHLPSEHVLEKKQFPLEFHFVHMDKFGHNLVVAVLFNIATDENPESGKELVYFTWKKGQHSLSFDPQIFLPAQKSYYYYTGSLTTPPTRGPVEWIVFDTVQLLKKTFVDQLKIHVTPNNNRPLQRLNGRKIYHN